MTSRLTICGLGPGGRGQVTEATRAALTGASRVVLRTRRHPTAELLAPGAVSFDDLYDGAETFDTVYAEIVDRVVAEAAAGGVVYAVPGSPLVLERTVQLLRNDPRVEVDLVPALSFLDEVWARTGLDPVDDGVRLVDGHRFGTEAAGERGPLLVAHVHAPWVLSEVKLALLETGADGTAVVLQHLGTEDERIVEVAWDELDRAVTPDHLTSVLLPDVAVPVARELARSVELMHRLRQDCPWDRAQDHRSLRRYLIEEAYEVLEAIDGLPPSTDEGSSPCGPVLDDAGEAYAHLEEELGDLWMQVLFHAELATEAGHFTVADVARGLHDKLVSRHPHVFGDEPAATAGEVRSNWERLKQVEKGRQSALDGIAPGLPALALADKMLDRMERAGTTVTVTPGDENRSEGRTGGSGPVGVGRELLALVARARSAGVDAELALRAVIDEVATDYRSRERAGERPPSWVVG